MMQIESVEQLHENRPVVVCFTNPYTCHPCRLLKPHFHNASKVLGEDVAFAEVDVTENLDVAAEFGVTATPTILYVGKDGVINIESRTTLPLIDEINEIVED